MSGEENGRAAKALNADSKGTRGGKIFVWRYVEEIEPDEGEPYQEDREVTLIIPRKFKRLLFSQKMGQNDLAGGLQVVFGREVVNHLMELEMDTSEFELFMDRLGEALGGTTVKN
jgi:hypothetical protein